MITLFIFSYRIILYSDENECNDGNMSELLNPSGSSTCEASLHDQTDDSIKNVSTTDYKSCCMYKQKHGECGPFVLGGIHKEGLVRIRNLDADPTSHLVSLHLKEANDANLRLTEKALLENSV